MFIMFPNPLHPSPRLITLVSAPFPASSRASRAIMDLAEVEGFQVVEALAPEGSAVWEQVDSAAVD